jgi:ribosomal protein S18 acetylase RimI-like enzyme
MMDTGRIETRDGWLTYMPHGGKTVELVDVWVRPRRRRRGVGRGLVRRLRRRFPGRTIYLFARAENAGAIAFYQAVGFRLAAELPGWYRRGTADARLYVWGAARNETKPEASGPTAE